MAKITVELLRAPGDSVIYLECGGDFIDQLTRILNAPLGSVLRVTSKCRSGEDRNSALERLCSSVDGLRDGLFQSAREIPKVDNLMMLEAKPTNPQHVRAAARSANADR